MTLVKNKKKTNAQWEKIVKNSPLHLNKTRDTKSVYFSDKGLRLTVDDNEGYALIATGYHTHVFQKLTASGISRPFLYTQGLIDCALENDCATEAGCSFAKLLEVLKAKEDKTDFYRAMYTEWWMFCCFQPLFLIGESEAETFLVYEAYLHNMARNEILLGEKTEPITNKQFIDRVCDNIKEFSKNMEENVLFDKKSDEEVMREEMEAMAEQDEEEFINGQKDGGES